MGFLRKKKKNDKPRSDLKETFGSDMGGVKVHQGSSAEKKGSSLGSEAYSTGNAVVFKDDSKNDAISASEDAHVGQQGSRTRKPDDEDE